MNVKQALIFFLICSHVLGAPKRKKPEEGFWAPQQMDMPEKAKAGKRLGDKLTGLYKKNKLSAEDISQLLQNADEAGLEFANPIPKKKKHKPEEGSENERDKNAARSLDRWLRRNNTWPKLYWAKVPMKNPKKKVNDFSQQWLPFLLPHEWLSDYLHQPGAWAEAMPEEGTFYARKLAQACDSWGLPHGSMLPIGLFGDGVPVQGRMNQSTVDFWTLNLPCSSTFSSWRIPIRCLDARMIGAPTIKAMCEIIHWSLDSLAKGKFPEARHDGSPWLASDSNRKSVKGSTMPGKAVLLQIRSDWDWNQKVFGAPQWNELKGCCWLCAAKPDNWKALSQNMARHDQSLDKAAFLELLRERGKEMNPLFQLPNVSNDTMMPDWMHCVDEGVGAMAAGQVLKELLPFYPGSNQDERCANLWQHIQDLYQEKGWPASRRLKKLTLKDIVKPKKAAELDCKAHEVRHFCPLLECLCKAKCLHEGTPHHKAVYKWLNIAATCTTALRITIYKSL